MRTATAPWRPADIAQREGRIIRQGNQNSEVSIYRYVTEESFDTYSWQTLERKAAFINQVMCRTYTGRGLAGDISDEEMSYVQVKAIALGNPLVMEEARLKNLVTPLAARSEGHDYQLRFLRQRAPGLANMSSQSRTLGGLWESVATQIQPTAGDAFAASFRGFRVRDRAEAAEQLRGSFEAFTSHYHRQPDGYAVIYQNNGITDMEIGGMKVSLAQLPRMRTLDGAIDHNKPVQYSFVIDELRRDSTYWRSADGAVFTAEEMQSSPLGVLRRLENHLSSIRQRTQDMYAQAETGQDATPGLSAAPTVTAEQTDHLRSLTQPFAHATNNAPTRQQQSSGPAPVQQSRFIPTQTSGFRP